MQPNRAYAYRGQNLGVPGGNSLTAVTMTVYYVVITPNGDVVPTNGNGPSDHSGAVEMQLTHDAFDIDAAIKSAVRADQDDNSLQVIVLP